MHTIVYIHGVGDKPPCEELKATWDRALFGDDAPPSRMAYWANDVPHLLPEIDLSSADAASQIEALALDVPASGLDDSGLIAGLDLTPEGQALAAQLAPRMAAQATAGEVAADRALGLFPTPRKLLFRALLRALFKEADAYWFRGAQDTIRQRLRDELAGLEGPIVVVGHSLGSVIAYDVLNDAAYAGPEVALFVTIGSPLGVHEIKEQAVQPLRVCPAVREWCNFSDTWDVVALDKTLSEEYAEPGRIFDGVVNNDSWNHHAAEKYLAAPLLRRIVREHSGA